MCWRDECEPRRLCFVAGTVSGEETAAHGCCKTQAETRELYDRKFVLCQANHGERPSPIGRLRPRAQGVHPTVQRSEEVAIEPVALACRYHPSDPFCGSAARPFGFPAEHVSLHSRFNGRCGLAVNTSTFATIMVAA
ncbi:hypothetical protein DPEC_G00068020 [Dallia pectoralis]|uniref:Uncharacterized protein n=1 Tax=Dallia pectoralis TaxID=75939 RepID=A0ACC2H280_DALPE|nr:hypothetical protein DPEC_G00068020 [Dallia pectoralis]